MTLVRLWNCFPARILACVICDGSMQGAKSEMTKNWLGGRTEGRLEVFYTFITSLSLQSSPLGGYKNGAGGSKTQLSPSPIQKITGRGSLEMSRWLSNFISSSVLSIMRCLLSELWILDATSLEMRINHLKAGRVKSIVLLVIWRNGWLKKRLFQVLSKWRRVALHFLQQWQ